MAYQLLLTHPADRPFRRVEADEMEIRDDGWILFFNNRKFLCRVQERFVVSIDTVKDEA